MSSLIGRYGFTPDALSRNTDCALGLSFPCAMSPRSPCGLVMIQKASTSTSTSGVRCAADIARIGH